MSNEYGLWAGLVALACSLLLSACGQSGPLVLPTRPDADSSEATPAIEAGQEDEESDEDER